jgi:hypothetical protein
MRVQLVVCLLLVATGAVLAENLVEKMRRGVDSVRCGDANEGKTCQEMGVDNACCSKWGRCGTDSKSCLRENGCQSGACRSLEPRFVAADPVPVVKAAAAETTTADDSANIIVKTISNPVPLCKTCAAAKAESSEASRSESSIPAPGPATEPVPPAAALVVPKDPENSGAQPYQPPTNPAAQPVVSQPPPAAVQPAPAAPAPTQQQQQAQTQVQVEQAVNKIKEAELETELKARKLIDEATKAATAIGTKRQNDYTTHKKAKVILVMMPSAVSGEGGKLVAPVSGK